MTATAPTTASVPGTGTHAPPGRDRTETPTAPVTHDEIAALADLVVAPAWPLDRFVAVNPLWGLRHLPFHTAAHAAARDRGITAYPSRTFLAAALAAGRIGPADLAAVAIRRLPPFGAETIAGIPAHHVATAAIIHQPDPTITRRNLPIDDAGADAAAALDTSVAAFGAAYLDRTTSHHGAAWPLPHADGGLWAAWRRLARHDRMLRRSGGRGALARLRNLPTDPGQAAADAFDRLGVTPADRDHVLRGHLGRLPGYVAALRHTDAHPDDLVAWVAIRLVSEYELRGGEGAGRWAGAEPPAASPALRPAELASLVGLAYENLDHPARIQLAALLDRIDPQTAARLRLEAYEEAARNDLVRALVIAAPRHPSTASTAATAATHTRPIANLLCCIDVRSEVLRRHIEQRHGWTTDGVAGFFGAAIGWQPANASGRVASCPVLLEPGVTLHDTARHATAGHAAAEAAARHAADHHALHAAEAVPGAAFALAESGGAAFGAALAARTLAPLATSRLARRHRPAETSVDLNGLDLDAQVAIAIGLLRTIGLTGSAARPFGRFLIVCGHGATSTNNPHAAGLACGACGGNPGGPNARVVAAILNDPAVRDQLATNGIVLPDDCVAIPAEHDTTTDDVRILDAWAVPVSHTDDLARIRLDLGIAGAAAAHERIGRLPDVPRTANRSDDNARRHVRRRSNDAAQAIPEWGLAGNMAFVIGPRTLTADCNLGGRVFLHSYDRTLDTDASALTALLCAPVVVAHWISAQYHFSTVDPQHCGAGDKTRHNVVAGIGVTEGGGGDLRLGLPRQSVAAGDIAVHEPGRLLVCVDNDPATLDLVIDRHELLRDLFNGEWVALAARDQGGRWWRRDADAGWYRWTPSDEVATT